MSIATIYYSFGGNTKFMAKIISKNSDGKLYQIKEIVKRKKGFGFVTGAISSLLSLSSKIEPLAEDINSCDTIFIGSPIWAGHSAPALNSALKQISFSGKKVYLFATSAGGDSQSAKLFSSVAKRVEKDGGEVVSTFSLKFGSERVNPVDMKNLVELWLEKEFKNS